MTDGGSYKMSLEEKRQKAMEYLGNKHVLAKNSTFKYNRGCSVLKGVCK